MLQHTDRAERITCFKAVPAPIWDRVQAQEAPPLHSLSLLQASSQASHKAPCAVPLQSRTADPLVRSPQLLCMLTADARALGRLCDPEPIYAPSRDPTVTTGNAPGAMHCGEMPPSSEVPASPDDFRLQMNSSQLYALLQERDARVHKTTPQQELVSVWSGGCTRPSCVKFLISKAPRSYLEQARSHTRVLQQARGD